MRRYLRERFEVQTPLKKTPNGLSFRALDRWQKNLPVFVKFLGRGTYVAGPSFRARLLRLQGVRHSMMAPVEQVALTPRKDLCVTRGFVEGAPLAPWPTESSVSLTRWLISACSLLESLGLVHGRLKPSNILMKPGGNPVLLDIGLPPSATGEHAKGLIFLAPEVLDGQEATFESDLYSLGALLYGLTAGVDLFEDSNLRLLRHKCLFASPVPLSERANTSEALGRAIDGLLAKEPEPRKAAFRILQGLLPPELEPATRATFTGRQQELLQISDALNGTTGFRAIVVEGETGSGKTRLLEHLRALASLESRQVLVGRSFERDNRAFECILQVLEQRFQRLDRRLDHWIQEHAARYAESLQPLLPDVSEFLEAAPASSPSRGKTIADLVGTLLSLSTVDSTMSIALDDIHWADEGTIEVLEQLGWRSGEANARIILSGRRSATHTNLRKLLSQWQRADGICARTLSLLPFTVAETRELTSRLVLNSPIVNWVIDHAGGNPLFIEECARCAGMQPPRMPRKLTDLLHEDFRRHFPEVRQVAQVLSLFPKPIERDLASKITEKLPDAPRNAIERLLDTGLLVESQGRLSFRHDGMRHAIYRNIPGTRRRTYHGVIYSLLRTVSLDWASRAYHAEHSGLAAEAFNSYRTAADQCVKNDDFRTAIDLLESAERVAKLRCLDVSTETRFAHAECLVAVGRKQAARDLLLAMSSHRSMSANELSKMNEILSSSWVYLPTECLRYSLSAMECLPKDSPRKSAAMINLARAFAMCGRERDARRTLRRAESETSHLSRREADWSAKKGIVHIALCDYSVALDVLSEGARSGPLAPPILANTAVCLEHLGRLEEACAYQERALKLARDYGFLFGELISLVNLGAFSAKLGEFGRAQEHFNEGQLLFSRARNSNRSSVAALPFPSSDLAIFCLDVGEYASARKHISSAIRQLKNDRSSQKAIWVAIKAAEIYGRLNEKRRAEAALRRVDESELFESDFFAVERALLWHSGAGMSDDSRLAQLRECLQLTEKMGTGYQQCRVLAQLGAKLVSMGERTPARKRLAEARALATKHGYKPLAVRIDITEAFATDTKQRSRLLSRAYTQATRIGLTELAAESAFQIAHDNISEGHLKIARDYLQKCVVALNSMAEGLPPSVRKSYFGSEWRSESISRLHELDAKLRSSASLGSGRSTAQVDDLFRFAYQTAVNLGRATSIDDWIDVVSGVLPTVLEGKALIFLNVRGETECHPAGVLVDDALKRRVSKLYRSAVEEPFVRISSGQPPDGVGAGFAAWFPLAFRRHRFGGLYISVSRSLSERQIEFLTTIAMNASTTLAALLWSTEPPKETPAAPRYRGIVGRSPAMKGICAQIDIAARSEATVLVEGESGTGKELVAKAIHEHSARARQPFVAVDCGAIPETLIESELFGSCKGSFTGATNDRVGLIEASSGGTLFLDEISNTSPGLQVKLLRVLQEREVRRLGDTRGRKVDLRLIAATNADLDSLVEKGEFRQDLFYRLQVLHIVIPPLRQRQDDIPALAQAFLSRMNSTHGTRKRFHKAALAVLATGTYRGNVRELQNAVERAYFSTVGQELIAEVAIGDPKRAQSTPDAEAWFDRITSGKESFWKAVHEPYKARDISREKVRALMDVGLRATKGSYKSLASVLRVDDSEYRRFMDFLRRNNCQPDFRQYRARFRGLQREGGPPGPS